MSITFTPYISDSTILNVSDPNEYTVGTTLRYSDLVSDTYTTTSSPVWHASFTSRIIEQEEYDRLKFIEKKYMEAFGNGETKEVDILTNDRNITIK